MSQNLDLPEPSCRETQLLSKLMNPEFELDFAIPSSNTELYLFDLINGTQEMLNNDPKSDTEKYFSMMLGNTVEDMPVVDCERNFWMNEAVKAMTEVQE